MRQILKGYTVAELDGQTVSPNDGGYKCTLHSSSSWHCDSQKLTENMGSVRTLRKSTVSYAQTCTFCSLSACLYLPLSLTRSPTHTSIQHHTHTTPFSQITHGEERLVAGNVKLLCHVQSQSGSLTTVCRVGMCVCSAATPNPKANSAVSLGYQLSFKEGQASTFMTRI